MNKEYLSMAQASKLCPYEQGYLSLLARRGELRAEKKGRNWCTKITWLNEYIATKKPGDLIVTEEMSGSINFAQKKRRKFSIASIAIIGFFLISFFGFYFYGSISNKIADTERKSVNDGFFPTEIMKIPNKDGNYDIYGIGKMKLGEEKVTQD